MTVHRHLRPMPKRSRMKSHPVDDFVPYNEAFIEHLGKLDPRELVDSFGGEN